MNGLVLFFLVLGIYIAIVIALHFAGILKKYNISFYGPFLMWRTEKGKEYIDRLAKRHRRLFSSSIRVTSTPTVV